jgi:endonuclease/exonuclease/phosphatase family metal-dependent hydrolase
MTWKSLVCAVSATLIGLSLASSAIAAELRVATFNIQDFGRTKVNKPAIRARLSAIVRKFDIVAVQEISDAQNTVPDIFLAEINKTGAKYAYLMSDRTGREGLRKGDRPPPSPC